MAAKLILPIQKELMESEENQLEIKVDNRLKKFFNISTIKLLKNGVSARRFFLCVSSIRLQKKCTAYDGSHIMDHSLKRSYRLLLICSTL